MILLTIYLLVRVSKFVADHDIPGKYYAFITPTVSGYFQANLIGKILETPVNLSMHPPPIAERSYIEFPQSADLALTEVIDDNSKLEQRITSLENTIKTLENFQVWHPYSINPAFFQRVIRRESKTDSYSKGSTLFGLHCILCHNF